MAKNEPYIEPLRKLRADTESLPAAKRRELAISLGKAFESGKGEETAVALTCVLTNDSNWEVRKAVANLLSSLPNEIQIRLIAQLSVDPNAFVRRVVDQAIERRRQTNKNRVKQQRGLELVRAEFETFEKKHGLAAAKEAKRIVALSDEQIAAIFGQQVITSMPALPDLPDNVTAAQVADRAEIEASRDHIFQLVAQALSQHQAEVNSVQSSAVTLVSSVLSGVLAATVGVATKALAPL